MSIHRRKWACPATQTEGLMTDPYVWICPYCGLRGIADNQLSAAIRGIHHELICKGDK